MRTFLATITGLSMLALASVASAADATGKISAIDSENQQVTLDNGMSFTLSEDASIEGLKVGDEVTVTYEQQEGQNVASQLAPAQAK